MTNTADPDQLAFSEANLSGSTLFAKAEHIRDQQDQWSSFPAGAFQISYFKILLWQPNKMVADYKTHKLGRQSSNDYNCKISFTSLHWLWRK